MRMSRFIAEQMLAAVKMADAGTPVADVSRELGISHQTYYGWKSRFAWTGVDPMSVSATSTAPFG